jgi:hypothetical protein
MFLDFYALHKLMVKDKFPTVVIDGLLDDLHGV